MKLDLKQKPNGIYYIDVRVPDAGDGMKRQRISFDTRDPAEANAQLKQWMRGTHPKHWMNGAVVEPKKRRDDTSVSTTVPDKGPTMRRLFDLCHSDPAVWKETRSDMSVRSNIKILNEYIGDELVASMTSERIERLRDQLLAKPYAPGTVKRKLDCVSRALKQAMKYKDDKGRPWLLEMPERPTLRFKNNKDRVLSPAEEVLMFAAIDKRAADNPGSRWRYYRNYMTFLLHTAFRKGESLTCGPHTVRMGRRVVDGEAVQWPHLYLPPEVTKAQRAHMIPCSPVLADMLDTLNAHADGGVWFPIQWSLTHMLDQIRADVKEMGGNIDDVGYHTMRHTCLTRLALGGMDIQRLSKWANHGNIQITAERYVHLTVDALSDGIDILGTHGSKPAKALPNGDLSAIRNVPFTGTNRATTVSGTIN